MPKMSAAVGRLLQQHVVDGTVQPMLPLETLIKIVAELEQMVAAAILAIAPAHCCCAHIG